MNYRPIENQNTNKFIERKFSAVLINEGRVSHLPDSKLAIKFHSIGDDSPFHHIIKHI